MKLMGFDPQPLENDGVPARYLADLDEDDFMLLGLSQEQARLLVSDVQCLITGVPVELELADAPTSAAGSLLLNHLERGSEQDQILAAKTLPKICPRGEKRVVSALACKVQGIELEGCSPKLLVVVIEALRELAPKGDSGMINSLSRYLFVDDAKVRRATIMALQGIIEQDERNLKLANMLLAHLEDSDPSVRAAATDALGNFKKNDEDILWGIRHKIDFGDQNSLSIVFHALQDPEEQVRSSAVKVITDASLSARDDGVRERFLSLTLQYMLHPLPAVRQSAVQVASKVSLKGNQRICGQMLFMLQDSDWGVRREAALALSLLGDRTDDKVMQGLQALQGDCERHVREAAREASTRLQGT
ncbi:hypothetical protein GUITHDRAFT_111394 [Guillardia theta CCMP2712]|uniref:Condensin complex subunit 1 C-terminal domain-containing protein n=1 Tax=Guillardia theta (strain CCMP2712) TaxID=905079 RepID=L1J338_GUITC|nr:hypothetical protein GUITHDRAFT_111394 [Guillardia theta CCMP2712]EKX42722.1 hypothetical protein GUITHDRAFT_111394 [Guillardia theta CCMP2712]|eukprot:XP_005829702.1 hypothetical protein GUITHDRAFT_111394 [Guillardia theta CCMP2712]